MTIPLIRGTIERRLLVNYRVAPEIARRVLPAPFRPIVVHGWAIAGVCLIRLARVRPRGVPGWLGLRSENAAHRFAVEWDDDDDAGVRRRGVYIPRRDTSSRLNALAGGRVFPGVHHRARFDVAESDGRVSVSVASVDGAVRVAVSGRLGEPWAVAAPGSVFASLGEASSFFEGGALGYSATRWPGRYDGLELRCDGWAVEPLAVEAARSSYFDAPELFPAGSAAFDCALVMRDVAHEWVGRGELCCLEGAVG